MRMGRVRGPSECRGGSGLWVLRCQEGPDYQVTVACRACYTGEAHQTAEEGTGQAGGKRQQELVPLFLTQEEEDSVSQAGAAYVPEVKGRLTRDWPATSLLCSSLP